MRIIFAGTPDFAVPALQALLDAASEHRIFSAIRHLRFAWCLTQPDRPAGRGMKLQASPVKQLALQHNLNVFQPECLKPAEMQAQIAAMQADVMIVAAYGLIIPTSVLNMFSKGCYNIHASLLPRWRGAAPIHRALLAGDSETGVTIMEVVPKLDAGNMISKGVVKITDADTTQTLHDKLSKIGADLMVQAMRDFCRMAHCLASRKMKAWSLTRINLKNLNLPLIGKKSQLKFRAKFAPLILSLSPPRSFAAKLVEYGLQTL